MSRWRNIVRNAIRPRYGREMVSKVTKRLEPDTRDEARSWAADRAVSIESYCRNLDESLWAETVERMNSMAGDCRRRLDLLQLDLGGGGAYPLVYFLVRKMEPEVVVETGVAAGWTSRACLEALRTNGRGRLFSSDFPYFRLDRPERFVGYVVPKELREGWHLDIRGDRVALPTIRDSARSIDLFHYDSDKSYSGREFAMDVLSPTLAPSAAVLMDDIQDNLFFRDWVQSRGINFTVFEFEGKFLGATGLAGAN